MNAPTAVKESSFRSAVLAMLLAAAFVPLAAASDGVAYRVKDINTTVVQQTTRGIEPAAALGAVALAAPAVAHDQPLDAGGIWVTDGTAAGTRLVRNLHGSRLRDAVVLGGGVLFVGDSPATGFELWWSDGTTAGTRLVRDIVPGSPSSMPALVGVLDGVAYFAATDGAHGRELWRSDGTAAGTRLFADLNPGVGGSLAAWDDPDRAGMLYGGKLYFAADDGVHGRELWRSNGHLGGTYLLRSVVAGAQGGSPRRFAVAAGRLFFVADDPAHGAELWASDGSAAGTALVRDVAPGAAGSSPQLLGAVPGRLVFAVGDYPGRAVWASDGTAAGTEALLEIGVVPEESSAAVGSRVLFVAYENALGQTLWTSDGTTAGTSRLRDDLTGVGELRLAGNYALFRGYVGEDEGLWRTGGTPATTLRLGEGSDTLSTPVAAASLWLFSACDYGVHGWLDCRLERTDGTAAGTGRVPFDLASSPSEPHSLTARGDDLLFGVWQSDAGPTFFRSDGSGEGTYPVAYAGSGRLGEYWGGAPLADGEIVFPSWAEDEPDGAVFRTDGDLVSVVVPDADPAFSPGWFTRSGDQVYYADQALWRTDGTAAGTAMVRALEAFGLTDVFGKLWFAVGGEPSDERALWESSGTAATTLGHPLGFTMLPDEPDSLTPFDPARGAFFFRASEGLFLFDPVEGEALRLHDFSPGAPPRYGVSPRAVAGGRLFFFDGEPDGTCALWRSDGTPAGTVKVRNVGVRGCYPLEVVALGGRVYFRGCDGAAGCEPWASDGTAAGTERVADLDPGIFSSMPSSLTVTGDRLYFAACTAAAGCEPWISDGTRAGTHRVDDIASGVTGSRSSQFTAAGRLVYFSADDGTGSELWAVPVEIFYDGFETGNVSRW